MSDPTPASQGPDERPYCARCGEPIWTASHVRHDHPEDHPAAPQGPGGDVSAIRERLEAATPGPWSAREGWNLMPPMRYEIAAPEVEEWAVVEAGDNDWGPAGGVNKKADAEFIANAPTDIATLLAALSAEKEAHAETAEERDDYANMYAETRQRNGSLVAARDAALAERDEYLAMLCEGARPVEEVVAELRARLTPEEPHG